MMIPLSMVMSKLPKLQNLSASDHSSVVSLNLFVALLCACIVIGHLLEENRWVNESITALLIGVSTGVVILLISGGKSSHLLVFSEDLFFIYLLPPIIFNAGFQVKKKQFFVNFITIVMFGAIGTLVSCSIIAFGATQIFKKLDIGSLDIGDYLAIGAIFAATDSVCTLQVLNQDETPLLYSLVFGEGVVNDATSVVLFNAIQSFDLTHIDPRIALQFMGNFLYLFFSSTMLGVITGLLSAFIIKKLYFARHSTDREVALMMLMAYLSYILAELFYLSGILTVFFCGIVMSHYTWHNVTESSRVTTKHAFGQTPTRHIPMAAREPFNVTVRSPAVTTQRSPWHSPVPYLFGGLAAMLGLIAFALLILACSYWKLSGYLENSENDGERDLEAGEGGKGDETQKAPPVFEEKILVIMAGDAKPTFLATPISSRSSSFGDSSSTNSTSTCSCGKSDKSVEMAEQTETTTVKLETSGGAENVHHHHENSTEATHEASTDQTHQTN